MLACNFTDALPLSLNSLRLAGKGLTEIGFFLNVPTVVRPCDGTSGLVRGNRRKAVFAFKSLFSQRNLSRFPLQGARCCCVLRKCGKNRKPLSITRFSETKPQVVEVQDWSLVGRSRFYPALPESSHRSMRQISEPTSTQPFSRRETAGRGVAASLCARYV